MDALFTATQRRVLAVLFGEPSRAIHLRELLERTGAGHGAVQREVKRLVAAGLVRKSRQKNRCLIQANPDSPIHAELTTFVRNTVGLAEPLREAFALARKYLLACFATDEEGDLVVVAILPDHPIPGEALTYAREQAEQTLRRGVRILEPDVNRLRTDPWLAQVLRYPRVWLFGDEARLARLRE